MLQSYLGLSLLSAATLIVEIALSRIFSVAQWYHFAFMTVSLALLGFGASGSFLSIFQARMKSNLNRMLVVSSSLFWLTVLGGYLVANYVPFDSFCIAWDRRQLLYLATYYLSLSTPFFFSGLCISLLIAAAPTRVNEVYFSNLIGSGLGCLLVVVLLPLFGGAGTVIFAALLGAVATTTFKWPLTRCLAPWAKEAIGQEGETSCHHAFRPLPLASCLLLILLLFTRPPLFDIQMSPYKALSTILRYPDTRLVFTGWNAFSRVDVIESTSIKSAPGLSFAYKGVPPPQMGLTIDGDNLSAITRPTDSTEFIDYLPISLAYRLIPLTRCLAPWAEEAVGQKGETSCHRPKVLVIEPRGGLDVLVALHHQAPSITVVEDNPLIVEAVRDRFGDFAGEVYSPERVKMIVENGRSYARRSSERFDLVQLSLSDTFKVITSGAYSLSENYLYTVEAFADFYGRLSDGGLLVITRWLQLPPSECLRAGAIAIEALERLGVERPEEHIVAIRSFQTMTMLVKRGSFTDREIGMVKDFCAEKRFDLVYYPGIAPTEANLYNVLPEPYYYQAFHDLIFAVDRAEFYARYPYDVSPPYDDRPFFFHFFKWSQIPAILQSFGKTWQPFGGSGYLVLVALLALAILASAVLILLPLLFRRGSSREREGRRPSPIHLSLSLSVYGRIFLYFFLLGIGYLFVEIPLMQRFILFLGHPIYSFSTILFAVLFFSGLGSFFSKRVPLIKALILLSVVILLYPAFLPHLFGLLLGQSLAVRLLTSILMLAPLGFLMGIPFPRGVEAVNEIAPGLIPWAWGINGCASVLSSILSVMIAISFGFSWVLVGASVAYAVGLAAIYSLVNAPPSWARS